jgi:glycosyltransferase involved in cell wall biosynthesis
VIITFNEAVNIERCLTSLPNGAEVIILDSGSEDETVAVARKHGARVFSKPFSNHGAQKNAAIAMATRSWVMSIDADEVVSGELKDSILAVIKEPSRRNVAYRIPRRLHFLGKKMRFGKTRDKPIRLFGKDMGEFVGEIHEQLVVKEGVDVATLTGELTHWSYESISDYFERFNSYTSKIALDHQRRGRNLPRILHLMRPWFEFLDRYFIRLGFLDGYAGYSYALYSALYTFVKYAKLKELYAHQSQPKT